MAPYAYQANFKQAKRDVVISTIVPFLAIVVLCLALLLLLIGYTIYFHYKDRMTPRSSTIPTYVAGIELSTFNNGGLGRIGSRNHNGTRGKMKEQDDDINTNRY